jgi:hypothetical protein
LAARTAVVVVLGLAVVQVVGLGIHALDRVGLQRQAELRDLRVRVLAIYRAVVLVPPAQREAVVRDLDVPEGMEVVLQSGPPPDDVPAWVIPDEAGGVWRPGPGMGRAMGPLRPREVRVLGGPGHALTVVGFRLPEGGWLVVRAPTPRVRLFHSGAFLAAFAVMTLAAAVLIVWAVRRLVRPVRTLAAAAEALGRDVNAPALPEEGPAEVAQAAAAFNTMAARIRRFVQDRTELLTAIGHDLRTPITRLKLRAEFVEDEELRRRLLADVAELEAMVAAALAFGRDADAGEPMAALDLAELCRTLIDEAGDTWPEVAERLAYAGPAHVTVRARPLALKRAVSNLIANAVKYGHGARVAVETAPGVARVIVDDDGPGIPVAELERVFEPFRRLETSRSRETGGAGLGLPIARNILRGMGGDVVLSNRPEGGLRATATLPA